MLYSSKKNTWNFEEVIKFDLKCFKIHNSRVLRLSAPNRQCRCVLIQQLLIPFLKRQARWKISFFSMQQIKPIQSPD